MTHSLNELPRHFGVCALESLGQHVGSLAYHLHVLHHGKLVALVGHQLLQVVTLYEHRHVVGILDDVEQTAFIPRSFSHKSEFYHG